HDTTIAALLRTLQAKMEILGRNMPEYAATLIVELWKMADTHHYVRVLYVPNVESNPVVITQYIDGCDDKEFCLKDDFVARSQLFIPTDITAECKAQ
uniref:Uncharacterized protein n=1 Tax=Panagrolaimus sp. JU765 TaxID=591449 RepID=A0AC34R3N1_9BILA